MLVVAPGVKLIDGATLRIFILNGRFFGPLLPPKTDAFQVFLADQSGHLNDELAAGKVVDEIQLRAVKVSTQNHFSVENHHHVPNREHKRSPPHLDFRG